MRHNYSGRKLKRTASHKRALMANLATSLFEHKRLITTVAKAKELRPFAEQLITRAKNAYAGERSAEASGVDVHSRRMVARYIRNKAVLQELFDTIAPAVAERAGGYTRIVKLGNRRGDTAAEALIELVDWSNPQDGRVTQKNRKPAKVAKPKPMAAIKPAPVAAAPAVEEVEEAEMDAQVEEMVAETETVVDETPAVEEASTDESADAAADAESEEKND